MLYHIGEILLVAFDYVPSDFLRCNGQLLQINQYSALFALIGTTYGGNGTTTFALPNMTAPTNLYYLICIQGSFPARS